MSVLRITHIIDGLQFGGAERIVTELATRLPRDRYEVDVVTLSRMSEAEQPFCAILRSMGMTVTSIPKRAKLDTQLTQRLQAHMQARHSDIVHTHLFAADVWGTRAAVRNGVRAIISTEHGLNTYEGIVKQRLKRVARKKQHAIVAISKTVQAYVQEICPEVTDRVSVIYNGIDLKKFTFTEHRVTAVPLRIAVVGRMEGVKGQLDLIAALPFVRAPYQLHFIGDGTDRGAAQRLVKKLRLQESVFFDDARTDIEEVYRAAEIVIVPSRSEGLGMVALEALASGCAVIANRIPGLSEIITDKLHGLLVDMRDQHAVAYAVDTLIDHPEMRAQLRHAGSEMVHSRFSVDTMVLEYQQLYHSLLLRP